MALELLDIVSIIIMIFPFILSIFLSFYKGPPRMRWGSIGLIIGAIVSFVITLLIDLLIFKSGYPTLVAGFLQGFILVLGLVFLGISHIIQKRKNKSI